MRVALVVSRSFGVVPTGEAILTDGGFEVHRVGEEHQPLDAQKMVQLVATENPDVIICGAQPINKYVLAASKKLRMVMMHGIGIDHIDVDAATARGIVVANAPGTNTAAVADLTIATMLAMLRSLCTANQSTKNGEWNRYIGHELGGMTVGVIGTGRIGSEVVRRLHGFAPRVLAYDPVQNPDLVVKYNVHYVPLRELLKASDIITLHVPLTDKTKKMIGRREFELMKESAYLINTARAELVDEPSLYEFLKARRIAGAAIDVFAMEPPQSSPLLQLDNVLATPHMGAHTYEAMERMDRVCAETIIDTFRGKRCSNVLNPVVLDSFSY